MGVGVRIKEVRQSKSMTQGELSDFLGIPQSNLFRYENDTGKLTSEKIQKFYQLGINTNWLITGEGEMFLNSGETALAKREDVVYVRKLDIEAAAGVGIVNYPDGEVPIWVGLPASFIYPHNPASIALLTVNGSSMEPTMRHGDVLLVSEQDCRMQSEYIYIIRVGEELKVKRIDKLANKNIVIWSENPQYGRQEFTPQEWEEYKIEIVARVIKVIKNV